MTFLAYLAVIYLTLSCVCFGYLCLLYHKRHSQPSKARKRDENASVKLAVVIGSGGHTAEALSILKTLGPHYNDRTYIIADTDQLSVNKVLDYERHCSGGQFHIERIKRSREVKQSYFTSIFTTIRSLIHSLVVIWFIRPDVLLCNGPGTCIPVCLATAFYDLLRLVDTRIIFVESICRVQRLSLSGTIIYYMGIADLIAVQWKDLALKYPGTKFINDLHSSVR